MDSSPIWSAGLYEIVYPNDIIQQRFLIPQFKYNILMSIIEHIDKEDANRLKKKYCGEYFFTSESPLAYAIFEPENTKAIQLKSFKLIVNI